MPTCRPSQVPHNSVLPRWAVQLCVPQAPKPVFGAGNYNQSPAEHRRVALCLSFAARLLLLSWICIMAVTSPATANAQPQITKESEYAAKGVVRALRPGQIDVQLESGEVTTFKIQDADENALTLGKDIIAALPAKIAVSGTLPLSMIEKGMIVKLDVELNRFGKQATPVKSLTIVDVPPEQMVVTGIDAADGEAFVPCQVTGRAVTIRANQITLRVQKSKVSRNERLSILLDENGSYELTSDRLSRVVPGDTIESMKVVKFSTGDLVIREINILLTGKREKATTTFHDQLEQKFSHLSDEPAPARPVRSEHFVLITDVSERNAQILLAKLESMFSLICRYYGTRPREPIEIYVVRDLSTWPIQLPGFAVMKIDEGAGVTATASNGRQHVSVVYSCDDHGVCQHETVHAICGQTFGSPGPIWYAEGMAEVGQYWRPDQLEVNIDPVVIDYLTTSEKKEFYDIVKAGEITGDSWKAYAWRWAVCHLLCNNPNYASDFKKLGLAMMKDEEKYTFDSVFGKRKAQISFEYDEFVANLGSGYRVDLCAWDWSAAEPLSEAGRKKVEVKAAGGWHSTGVKVTQDQSYDFICQGSWKVHPEAEEVSAAGGSGGVGRMMAVIQSEHNGTYYLTSPFELGEQGTFVAPENGTLYVRCQDAWTELGDNSGTITAYFRRSPK
jgi:hypothetical protein